MRLSAVLCRKQEGVQRAIAANDPLESRRVIAAVAAKAWAAEAIAAEQREAGQLSALDLLDAKIAAQFAREDQRGETPD